MSDDYPSNSQMRKQAHPVAPALEPAEPSTKKIEKVVTGTVVRRKKSLSQRFVGFFTGVDARSTVDYVVYDVAVPALKDLVADVVSQGIDRRLFGETRTASRRGASRYGSSQYGHVAYDKAGRSGLSRHHTEQPRVNPARRPARAAHDFDNIIIPTRVEADAVIENMYTLLEQYNVITVAELLELCNTTGEWTDAQFGWYSLPGASVSRVRDGYVLNLPKPERLE